MDWSCPDHPVYILERFKTMCHEEVLKIYVSKQQMKFSTFGQEKEETFQKLSPRLTSTTPSTSVQQLHCPLIDLLFSTARITSISSTKQESVTGPG